MNGTSQLQQGDPCVVRLYHQGTWCKLALGGAVTLCALGALAGVVTLLAGLGTPGGATSFGLLMGGGTLILVGICLKPCKKKESNTIEMKISVDSDSNGVELTSFP